MRGRVPGCSEDASPSSSQNICALRAERPAEGGDHGRALQPATARGRGDDVAEAVRDVEMHGVAARRLAGARDRDGLADAREATATRLDLRGRLVPDEGAALLRVPGREQRVERDLLGVAVEGVAVGERKLRALGHDVDELGLGQLGEVVPLEQRELLERRRPCPPRACLADREPAVVEHDRRLERRLPRGEVVAREQAAFGLAEARDLLGDEALVVRLPRALDLLLAGAAPALVDDASIRRRERGVAEERACRRSRKVELRRAGPRLEQPPVRLDRRRDAIDERVAVLRVPDRVLEDVADPPRPEVAQEQEPAAEGTGNARRENAGARDELVAELPVAVDRRSRGCDTLAAEDERLLPFHGPEDRGHLAAGPVQVRLDDLEDEPGRARSVERIAAALQHRHPGRRGEPVRRRDHPERAAELGSRGEGHAPESTRPVQGPSRRSQYTRRPT